MGYNTSYTLVITKPGNDNDEQELHVKTVAEFRKECEYAEFALDGEGSPAESATWYNHEDDLKEFSIKHPELLFELQGVGDNSEDLWIKYFRNGKMQECRAEIVYPEFDESKMK